MRSLQEWHHRLRSSVHPYLFASVYWIADRAAAVLRLNAATRAELLLASPKILQALFAANMDYYTWRLGERVYGKNSYQAWAAVSRRRTALAASSSQRSTADVGGS